MAARGIDHLVLAARDLDQAADFYRRLGFTVGARNRHAWGTLNHIVQLDGSFLELISTETGFVPPAADAPVFPFAGFLHGFLKRREGFAMLVLASDDARTDARAFAARGIGTGGPFFFERKGRRVDGSEVHVAFTLAFAATPAVSDAGFFVCQQHFPDAFWSKPLQSHANTAARIAAVTLQAGNPGDLGPFLASFTGIAPVEVDGGIAYETGRGRVEVLAGEACRRVWGQQLVADAPVSARLAGFRVAVRDLAATKAALEHGRIEHAEHGGRLIVPATAALGTVIAFEAV